LISILLSGFVAAQQTLQQQKDSLRRAITLAEGTEKLKIYPRLSNLYMPDVRQEHVIDTIFAIYDELDAKRDGKATWKIRGLSG
jgi:hypothetical protein